MSVVNTRWAYFDVYKREFYSPRESNRPVFGFSMPRLDWVRIRLAVTYGKPRINATTGIPTTNGVPLSEYTSSLFALKTVANFFAANGDLAFSNGGGFDTSDSAWHAVSTCCVTLAPIVIGLDVLSAEYMSEIVLLKTSPTRRWTLAPDGGLEAPRCHVMRDVYTGVESNAPSGLAASTRGTWAISGAVAYVDVAVTGATSSTFLALSDTGTTGGAGEHGPITQTPLAGGANTVRLSVPNAPGTGATWTGGFVLLDL